MPYVTVNEEVTRGMHVSVYREDGSCQRVHTCESVYIDNEVPVETDAEADQVVASILFNVSKSKEDSGLVSGWANVAVNADGSVPLDWQDDVIAPEELEKAAINFMLDYRESGEMHKGNSKGTVVESIVFTKEKQQALGIPEGVVPEGWFITVKVTDPEVFAKVKSGEYKMFSIQGKSKRTKLN